MITATRDLVLKVLKNTSGVTDVKSSDRADTARSVTYTLVDGLRKFSVHLVITDDDTEGVRIYRYYRGPRTKKLHEYGIYMWYPVLECFEESFAEKLGTMHVNITSSRA